VSTANNNYAISRIDQPSKKNHGYYVRISHRGKSTAKYFPDKKSGGKTKALRLAREYRDALLKKMPRAKQEAAKRKRRKIPKSGVIGVTHVVSKAAGGKSYDYWQAAWQDSRGKRRTAKFSIGRYGSKKALTMAKNARRDALSGKPSAKPKAKSPARKTAAPNKKAAPKRNAAAKKKSTTKAKTKRGGRRK
jgi:hypothetical protein